ncbi:MAG: hypothetical protein AAFY21_11385, partial [Cyanobacteria bacterium J06641_2]
MKLVVAVSGHLIVRAIARNISCKVRSRLSLVKIPLFVKCWVLAEVKTIASKEEFEYLQSSKYSNSSIEAIVFTSAKTQ